MIFEKAFVSMNWTKSMIFSIVSGTVSPRWMWNQATERANTRHQLDQNLLSLTQDFDAWWAYFFVALVPFLEDIDYCPLEEKISMIVSVVPMHPTNACCEKRYFNPFDRLHKSIWHGARPESLIFSFKWGTASWYLGGKIRHQSNVRSNSNQAPNSCRLFDNNYLLQFKSLVPCVRCPLSLGFCLILILPFNWKWISLLSFWLF